MDKKSVMIKHTKKKNGRRKKVEPFMVWKKWWRKNCGVEIRGTLGKLAKREKTKGGNRKGANATGVVNKEGKGERTRERGEG